MEDKSGYGPPPAYPAGQQPGYPPPQGQYPPPQGQYPPPQGQYPPPQGQYPPMQGQPMQGYAPPPGQYVQQPPTVVVQQQPATATVVVAGAGCPRCGGIITEDFTCCGILLAICFFPLGLVCCFLMRERRCTNCGAAY